MKVLVADYGLNCWYGCNYDYEERLKMLKELGYDGIERLEAATEAEVIYNSALAKKCGMEFATCRGKGNNHSQSILWSAAIGKKYVWLDVQPTNKSKDLIQRISQEHITAAKKYGLSAAIHNHLGAAVETQEQLIAFLEVNPDCGIILDIGHLVGAGGDPLEIVERYFDRIVMVHLKDYVSLTKDMNTPWDQRIRFCELGTGELGDLTGVVINRLKEKGYTGYLAVEQDVHLRDPKIDLKNSREFIRKYGV